MIEPVLPTSSPPPAATLIALVQEGRLRRRIEEIAAELQVSVAWTLSLQGVVKQVAELRPLVILVDLRNADSAWAAIVRELKSSPATRRLAVLGFAYDLDDALLAQAKTVFMDEIFDARDDSRGRALVTLADRIRLHARRSDQELQAALQSPCAQLMPPLVKQGLEEFNAGEYYECHETLEHAWMAETGAVRNLYRGILQIGVAYYQIQRRNYWGAIKMFLRALQWLEPLPDRCQGIHVAKLRQDSKAAQQALEALGPERVAEFDFSLLKPVGYDSDFVAQERLHE